MKPILQILLAAVLLAGCTKETYIEGDPSFVVHYPDTLGSIVFYAWQDCHVGNITVSLQNRTGILTSFFPFNAPACGDTGTFTATGLAPGVYNYTAAAAGNYSWQGTVRVTAGQCTKQRLECTQATKTTGTVVFYTSSGSGGRGDIQITVNGMTDNISGVFPINNPDCTTIGTLKWELPPGTYNYTAKCTGRSWSGSFVIIANQCTFKNLVI